MARRRHPRPCDACGKRRVLAMHPIGLDLCRECTIIAERSARSEPHVSGSEGP